MSIIRISKRANPYAQIDKGCLEDKGLSFRAKGVLCYLLSKPDKWQIRVTDLVNKTSKEGRDSIQTALKELETMGYLSKTRIKGPGGKFAGVDYEVREQPITQPEKPQTDLPCTANPQTAEPCTANPLHSNNESFTNNDLSNNEIEAANAPSPLEQKGTLTEQPQKEGKEKSCAKKEKDTGWAWWVDTYYKFVQQKSGQNKPILHKSDYAGLRHIKEALIQQQEGEAQAQSEFLYILTNWGKLENYHQRRLKATQINSELLNIQNSLRNPQSKVSGHGGNQQNNPGKQTAQSFEDIEARYS
jgi:hypothetical protein